MVQDFDGAKVVDRNGQPIGAVERTFDDSNGVARYVEVKLGALFGKHRLIPVEEAQFADGALTVPYTKDIVTDSPDARAIEETLDGDVLDAAEAYYSGLRESALPASKVALGSDRTEQ